MSIVREVGGGKEREKEGRKGCEAGVPRPVANGVNQRCAKYEDTRRLKKGGEGEREREREDGKGG